MTTTAGAASGGTIPDESGSTGSPSIAALDEVEEDGHSEFLDLGCDAAEPQRLATFWALAPGYTQEPGFDELDNASIDPAGRGPAIGFLRVPEGKTAKNRMHIDIRVAGEAPWDMAERERLIRKTVPQLVAAGATVVREDTEGGVLDHVVMLDPEGNEFCVA